jgi:hypothetical protein
VRRLPVGQELRDRFDHPPGPQHPYVDGGYLDVGRQLSQRLSYEVGSNGLYATDAAGGLHGEGGDASHAVASVGGDGLYIGGDSRPGRWVETGDGQNDGRRGSHISNCTGKPPDCKLPKDHATTGPLEQVPNG